MALISIYSEIAKRHDSRMRLHPDNTESRPNSNPITYLEADHILAYEIAYYGLLIKPPHIPMDSITGILSNLYYRVFAMHNMHCNGRHTTADIRYKNIIRQLHNFRQRYWYWKPFNIMCDYSCY